MSKDIVERLRDEFQYAEESLDPGLPVSVLEAADEIERLRAVIALGDKMASNELQRQQAEIERLRAAGDALADSLRRSEEHFYAHWFEEGVVNERVREYVSEHSSLVAWREARRER